MFPLCCLTWGQTMVEVMKTMATSFKRSHACTAALRALDPAAGHRHPSLAPETPGYSRASLGQSLVGSLPLSPGSWCTQGFVCALQESVSPVLCKFWHLRGGLMVTSSKRLCHTQVCCTQSPWPCGRPLLAHTSSGDTQHSKAGLAQSLWGLLVCTRFCLSLLSVSGGYGVSKCDFVPLPSCWGFSFVLGRGVSFFGGIQHSPVDGCSAASCNFGVLAREDDRTSFYSAIL